MKLLHFLEATADHLSSADSLSGFPAPLSQVSEKSGRR
jgi:hypothetical protein